MPKFILIFVIFSMSLNHLASKQCDSCKADFDILLKIREKSKVSLSDIQRSWQITNKLYKLRYTDYIDSVINKTENVSHSLTKTFSDICINADSKLGVDYYLQYLNLTKGSVEEERSLSLERLFARYPETLLKAIGKDNDLLDDISWGFQNNRLYGAVNPFEGYDYTAMLLNEKSMKPILNKDNCKAIFFETYPVLSENYLKYKYQIDYIINSTIESLEVSE
ncbi:hypothetical protein MASR1M45_08050 [Candidatus Kapaibacterium sp.]